MTGPAGDWDEDSDEHRFDPTDRDDYSDEHGPCIGAECVSGIYDHDRSECVTAEMMADYHRDGMIGELVALPTDALRARCDEMRALLAAGDGELSRRLTGAAE